MSKWRHQSLPGHRIGTSSSQRGRHAMSCELFRTCILTGFLQGHRLRSLLAFRSAIAIWTRRGSLRRARHISESCRTVVQSLCRMNQWSRLTAYDSPLLKGRWGIACALWTLDPALRLPIPPCVWPDVLGNRLRWVWKEHVQRCRAWSKCVILSAWRMPVRKVVASPLRVRQCSSWVLPLLTCSAS